MSLRKRTFTTFLFITLIFSIFIPSAYALSCPECGSRMTGTTAYEASCDEEGLMVYTCTNAKCGDTIESSIPPLGHAYRSTTDATCTSPGSTTYTCSRCQDTYVEKTAALGHSYRETTEEPTCTEDGYTMLSCVRCGIGKKTVLPALDHDYVTEETAPTCTEDGIRTETCTRCEDVQTEAIPATGHSYSENRIEPTCTTDGSAAMTCTVCGDEITEVLPATGHSFGDWTVIQAPTLSKAGYEERYCSGCDASERNELPQKTLMESPAALAVIAAASIAVVTAVVIIIKKAATAAAVAGEAASLSLISLPMKHVILYTKDTPANKAFRKKLSNRPYLDIKEVCFGQLEELKELAGKEKPDLIIASVDLLTGLSQTIEMVSASYKDAEFAAIDETGLNSAGLSAMKEQGKLINYAVAGDNGERMLARLILPLYKPDKSAGNWADNATMITDALGLPIISTLLSAFVVGGDVVELVQKRGVGMSDAADLVSDVAALLGLDTLVNVAEVLRVSADQRDRAEDNKELKNK